MPVKEDVKLLFINIKKYSNLHFSWKVHMKSDQRKENNENIANVGIQTIMSAGSKTNSFFSIPGQIRGLLAGFTVKNVMAVIIGGSL